MGANIQEQPIYFPQRWLDHPKPTGRCAAQLARRKLVEAHFDWGVLEHYRKPDCLAREGTSRRGKRDIAQSAGRL